jgi:hypothetical protein
MGNQPFGKLPQIIQAARRGDPRATQMLNRLRKVIDDALRSGHGPKGKPARRGMGPPPPAKAAGFRLVKPTAKLDVVELGAAGNLYIDTQSAKKAEIARRKAEVKKAHADMIKREKKAKAHYEKLQRGQKAMRKNLQKDEYARIKKLMAESERLQEEIRRLRAELGAKRR